MIARLDSYRHTVVAAFVAATALCALTVRAQDEVAPESEIRTGTIVSGASQDGPEPIASGSILPETPPEPAADTEFVAERSGEAAEMEVIDVETEIVEEVELIEEVAVVDPTMRYGGPNSPHTERGINVPLARTTRANALLITIDHRAQKTFLEDTWIDYFGLDAGSLKIGIGLRYGIVDDVDVGVYRLNNTVEIFDTYELDGRWRFLRQADHHLNIAVRAGITWFVQPKIEDAVGFLGQLLVDRVFFDQLLVAAGFLFHSESSNDRKALADDAYSGAIAVGLEWRFIESLALNAEMAANVMGYGSDWPTLALAFEIVTARHTFALVFSNTQYITADGIVTGAWRGFDELVFGFQITREINL